MLYIFLGLFIVNLAWGIISTIFLSSLGAERDSFAKSYKQSQERVKSIEGNLDITTAKLAEATTLTGRLQGEINRVRELLGASEIAHRGLDEKLTDLERLIESSQAGFEDSTGRITAIERGLEEIESIVQSIRR